MMMETTVFNPVQQHLLRMFSHTKDEATLIEVKKVLTDYFAQKVEKEMDALWEQGLWNQEKNEEVLKEHLRTSYRLGRRAF